MATFCSTKDGTIIKHFINGVQSATGSVSGDPIYTSGKRLYISRFSDSASRFFNGQLDDLKIYNYALSADEIKQDYNQGATAVIGKSTQTIGATTTSLDYCIPGDTSHCAAPIAEYNFEEGVGTTVYDKSGNGNNLKFNTGTPLWKAGKNRRCLIFHWFTGFNFK
jgi:hypothetical protein